MLYLADPSDRMGILIGSIFHITSGKGLQVYEHKHLRIFQNMGYDRWIGSQEMKLKRLGDTYMPMIHNFVIENKSDVNEDVYTSYSWDRNGKIHKNGLTRDNQAHLDDNFISYIHDSLQWLETTNPSTGEKAMGLNNYGITVIEDQQVLQRLYQILNAWIDLFGSAPDSIKLRGDCCVDDGDRKGYYEELVYNKSDLITELKKLTSMAVHAAEHGKCIVHFGI